MWQHLQELLDVSFLSHPLQHRFDICKAIRRRYGNRRRNRIEEFVKITEVFHGGVDGVAAMEEQMDQPRADAATGAGDTDYFSFRRH